MKKSKEIVKKFAVGGVVVVILGILWILWLVMGVRAHTDSGEYQFGEKLRVTVKNWTVDDLCFSNCTPYHFVKIDSSWSDPGEDDCGPQNLAERCVIPGDKKTFELGADAMPDEAGEYQITIPFCKNCVSGQFFTPDSYIFTNKFQIK